MESGPWEFDCKTAYCYAKTLIFLPDYHCPHLRQSAPKPLSGICKLIEHAYFNKYFFVNQDLIWAVVKADAIRIPSAAKGESRSTAGFLN
jgi:hypothetical protein